MSHDWMMGRSTISDSRLLGPNPIPSHFQLQTWTNCSAFWGLLFPICQIERMGTNYRCWCPRSWSNCYGFDSPNFQADQVIIMVIQTCLPWNVDINKTLNKRERLYLVFKSLPTGKFLYINIFTGICEYIKIGKVKYTVLVYQGCCNKSTKDWVV